VKLYQKQRTNARVWGFGAIWMCELPQGFTSVGRHELA